MANTIQEENAAGIVVNTIALNPAGSYSLTGSTGGASRISIDDLGSDAFDPAITPTSLIVGSLNLAYDNTFKEISSNEVGNTITLNDPNGHDTISVINGQVSWSGPTVDFGLGSAEAGSLSISASGAGDVFDIYSNYDPDVVSHLQYTALTVSDSQPATYNQSPLGASDQFQNVVFNASGGPVNLVAKHG